MNYTPLVGMTETVNIIGNIWLFVLMLVVIIGSMSFWKKSALKIMEKQKEKQNLQDNGGLPKLSISALLAWTLPSLFVFGGLAVWCLA